MKEQFTPVDYRQYPILNPIYISREQFEDYAFLIPEEDEIRKRIIIVDFVEEVVLC